jgi:hypothetical protein
MSLASRSELKLAAASEWQSQLQATEQLCGTLDRSATLALASLEYSASRLAQQNARRCAFLHKVWTTWINGKSVNAISFLLFD